MHRYVSNISISKNIEIPVIFDIYIECRNVKSIKDLRSCDGVSEIVGAYQLVNGKEIPFDIDSLEEEKLNEIEERAYLEWDAIIE
jgi:hypothetical protein